MFASDLVLRNKLTNSWLQYRSEYAQHISYTFIRPILQPCNHIGNNREICIVHCNIHMYENIWKCIYIYIFMKLVWNNVRCSWQVCLFIHYSENINDSRTVIVVKLLLSRSSMGNTYTICLRYSIYQSVDTSRNGWLYSILRDSIFHSEYTSGKIIMYIYTKINDHTMQYNGQYIHALNRVIYITLRFHIYFSSLRNDEERVRRARIPINWLSLPEVVSGACRLLFLGYK